MTSLRRLPIAKKIIAITLLISTAALLVASTALVAYDYVAARRELTINNGILARVAADQLTAAVSFNDRGAALETLNTLHAEPSIVTACVYSGFNLFVERTGDTVARCPANVTSPFPDASLEMSIAPINLKGKQIGTVRLQTTLQRAYSRMRVEIAAIAIVLVVSALFAYALAAGLHKFVSEPILRLARTAREVSIKKDYSIQAVKQSDDELGTLVDSFNEMMEQIRRHEIDLHARTVELEAANEDLNNASKMKDEFLATLSHELRTPLNAVLGWVSLLKNKDFPPDKAGKAIEVIDRNAKAQLLLVNDLLNVSQIVTGKLKIHPEWTNAGAIIRTAVESIQPAATAKGVSIVAEIADPEERVFADPERIQQVLWNLLVNAIKFSAKHSRITIACGRSGASFQVIVTDYGDGIEPEFIPHLFERFSQADASRSRKYGGLGLGLAIVRHIVESHGGNVSAVSEGKGRGAAFTIVLPIPPVQRGINLPGEFQVTTLEGTIVLVVEDDVDARDIVIEALQQAGATVLAASSGPEALRLLTNNTPDVIVSDIGMPGMDGYQLLLKIRSDARPRVRFIPALALTAFSTKEDKQRSLQAGYQAYLVKPVSTQELAGAVADLARRTRRTG